MSNINECLDKAKARFQDPNFLKNKGLANEVGIYIFNYNPQDEMAVRYFLEKIKSESSFNPVEFDLYDILITYIKDRKLLERIPKVEERMGKDEVTKQLKRLVTPKMYVEKMKYDNHKYGDILIISGVGKVYPFTRVHTLLENVTTEFKDIPIVVFYPGNYDLKTLTLFNKYFDDNHYRSFSLID